MQVGAVSKFGVQKNKESTTPPVAPYKPQPRIHAPSGPASDKSSPAVEKPPTERPVLDAASSEPSGLPEKDGAGSPESPPEPASKMDTSSEQVGQKASPPAASPAPDTASSEPSFRPKTDDPGSPAPPPEPESRTDASSEWAGQKAPPAAAKSPARPPGSVAASSEQPGRAPKVEDRGEAPGDADPVSRQARSTGHSHHRVPNHGMLPGSGIHPSPYAPRVPVSQGGDPASPTVKPPALRESASAAARRFLDTQQANEKPVLALAPGLASTQPYFSQQELEQTMDPKAPLHMSERQAVRRYEGLDDSYRKTRAFWNTPGNFNAFRDNIQRNFDQGIDAQKDDGTLTEEGAKQASAASRRSNPGQRDEGRSGSSGTESSKPDLSRESSRLQVANWSSSGRTSDQIVRIRDPENQRNLLYVPGQQRPFYEFASDWHLQRWADKVGNGRQHALDPYFPVKDRVESDADTQREPADPNAATGTPATKGNDEHDPDFMTRSALRIQNGGLQDTLDMRGAVLDKLRTTYPTFRKHQLKDVRAQQRGLDPNDLRIATSLYTQGVKKMPPEGPNAAYIRAQKKITDWAEHLEATHNKDLSQVSDGAITRAVQEFKQSGQKIEPVRVATRASEMDNTDELERQMRAYADPALNLGFYGVAKRVQEERYQADPPVSSERQKLARQRDVLADVQRLSADGNSEAFLGVSDDAWLSAARQAARSYAKTGRHEDILDTAKNALSFRPSHAPSGKGKPPAANVEQREKEAGVQREKIHETATILNDRDERLFPIARQYETYYGKPQRTDGSFDRENDFAKTVEGFGQSADIGATPPVTEADMQKAKDEFRTTPKGAVRPTPREFLERAQTHALDRQFAELERARGHDDVVKEPVPKYFEWSFLPPEDRKLKYFSQSFTDAWNNPFGELAATIMRPAGASPETIAKVKDVVDTVQKTIELGSFSSVGAPLAIRPVVASVLSFINRRVQDHKEYTKQSLKDDITDVATVIWNAFATYHSKISFKFNPNPYTRLGP